MNKYQKKKNSTNKGSFSANKKSPKEHSGFKKRDSSSEKDFKKKPYEKKSFDKPGRLSKSDNKKDDRNKTFERTSTSFRKKDSPGYKPRDVKRDSSERDFKNKPYEKKSFDKPGRLSKSDDRKDERGKHFEKRSLSSSPKKDSPGFKSREEKGDSFGKPYKHKPYEKKTNAPRPLKKATTSEKDTLPQSGQIRLNKYIANSGICSRREADKLIEEGLIKVNETVVTELGYKVNRSDVVKYENRVLNREKLIYVLLNKPKDFITTMDDPQDRKTVMTLVSGACKERIYPVGRLDRNTTGLLLLTNDGELADKLTHPSNEIKKIYQVDIDKPISNDDFDKILNGLELEDGPVKVDEIAIVSSDKKSFGIEIHQGRNRIVRRIFEHLGYDVVRLDRVMYAGLTKKDLARGHWRFLTEKEVIRLKHF